MVFLDFILKWNWNKGGGGGNEGKKLIYDLVLLGGRKYIMTAFLLFVSLLHLPLCSSVCSCSVCFTLRDGFRFSSLELSTENGS